MNTRRLLLLGVSLAVVASACSSVSSHDAATRDAAAGLGLLRPTASDPKPSPPNCTTNDDTARSFAPDGPLPAPGAMRAGSFMDVIRKRGYLIAGVDQNTPGFGYREPDNQIKGFDIDIVGAIATAIFGTPNVRLKAVTTAQRKTAVENGDVDLVASLFSITCDRWQDFDFSTEYYAAKQGVLVPADSPIKNVRDLNGKRVCATKTSTSIDQIRKFAPHAILDGVDLRPECLVHLQEGLADAISSDDTILYGLQLQDRLHTRILNVNLHQPERYGIAINKAHPEFVRFVNAVLEQIRSDGRWDQYHRQLETLLHIPPTTPPAPLYGRQP
jgi:polar amino acid transport system substrate-binding protein